MINGTVCSTGPGSMRCTLMCRCLTAVSIPFTAVDLTEERNAAPPSFIPDELGYSEAPFVLVDDHPQHHWAGFRPDLIERLVARLIERQGI